MRSDLGHKLTDKELEKLEKRISSVYSDASKEMDKTVQEYFEKFKTRDQEMHQLVLDGKWDERKYKQWRLAQIGRGKRFEAMRDKLAEQATEANERAIAYVNDAMPNVYAINRNYAAYTIEQASGAVDFTLYDEGTVRRLLAENPATMPYYPPKRAINRGIDLTYGQRQITASVTSGILRGNSIKKIADELQTFITDMSRTSAVRAARTAVTSAQNGGRQASYDAAEKMGIHVQKEWMATRDERTRYEHGAADGQVVDKDEPFKVGGEKLMFPGDPSGSGWNIYNCRCTMRAVLPESPYQKRQTYSEWLEEKEAYMASSTGLDYTRTTPTRHTAAEYSEIRKYAEERGIRISHVEAFDGDMDLLYEQIDKISAMKDEYQISHRLTVGFNKLPSDTPASTSDYTISLNKYMFRNKEVTEEFLRNSKNLAAEKMSDIATHEMGHIIERRYGQKGLEIAGKTYYTIFSKALDNDSMLDFLEREISAYSTVEYGKMTDDFVPSNFREIIPEVLVRNENTPTAFTREYIRAMKMGFQLW